MLTTDIVQPNHKISHDLSKLRRARTLSGFLRRVTSPYQHGWKKTGESFKQYTKEFVIEQYNKVKYLRKWSKLDLVGHQISYHTIYYSGAGGLKTPFTLVMLDIDVLKALKKGSKAGAVAFVDYLKTIWPDLYWEPSTNGNGVHGYLLLDKRLFDAAGTNKALHHLQSYLRSLAVGFDIEQVEVKGTCPLVDFDGKGKIEAITYGQMAKLPRHASLTDLKHTTCLTVREVLALRLKIQPAIVDYNVITDTIPPTNEYTSTNGGSISGVPFSEELRESLTNGALEELAAKWIGTGLVTSNRAKVTPAEFAFAVATIAHCTTDGNLDGSLPTARAKAIWDAAEVEDMAPKPWNCHKWAAARNWLESHGYLTVQDMGFSVGTKDAKGQYHKGYAARWGASEQLLEVVAALAHPGGGNTAAGIEAPEKVVTNQEEPAPVGFNLSSLRDKDHLYSAKQNTPLSSDPASEIEAPKHPREPNPLAVAYGIPTYRSPYFREATRHIKRA